MWINDYDQHRIISPQLYSYLWQNEGHALKLSTAQLNNDISFPEKSHTLALTITALQVILIRNYCNCWKENTDGKLMKNSTVLQQREGRHPCTVAQRAELASFQLQNYGNSNAKCTLFCTVWKAQEQCTECSDYSFSQWKRTSQQ